MKKSLLLHTQLRFHIRQFEAQIGNIGAIKTNHFVKYLHYGKNEEKSSKFKSTDNKLQII